jgi:hypothetical protein
MCDNSRLFTRFGGNASKGVFRGATQGAQQKSLQCFDVNYMDIGSVYVSQIRTPLP